MTNQSDNQLEMQEKTAEITTIGKIEQCIKNALFFNKNMMKWKDFLQGGNKNKILERELIKV